MQKTKVQEIIDSVYAHTPGLSEADCAAMIRQVARRLEDMFYDNAPSISQAKTIKALLSIADQVEAFFK